MLLAEATIEQKTEISKALAETLTELGVKNAKRKRINFTTSRPDETRLFSGSVLRWNAGATALVLTRYANGDGWSPTRIVNAGVYLDAIISAGFIAEMDGKKLVITGRN